MTRWVWFSEEFVLAVHEEQLREHGGLPGIRDRGLLSSALSKPQQLAAYTDPDAAAFAAAYAFGVARNYPFFDGNKRMAFVLAESFLLCHGQSLIANDEQCYLTMLSLAAGELSQEAFAEWLRANTAIVADA
jgi:death on curing protein